MKSESERFHKTLRIAMIYTLLFVLGVYIGFRLGQDSGPPTVIEFPSEPATGEMLIDYMEINSYNNSFILKNFSFNFEELALRNIDLNLAMEDDYE